MNRFNPEKLLLSKWTAVTPFQKQKHFIITELIRDEQQRICGCIIEAVMTGKSWQVDYHELKANDKWLQGWK